MPHPFRDRSHPNKTPTNPDDGSSFLSLNFPSFAHTMSFPSAIAGPSRLPYRAIAVTCCRTIASARSYATAEGGAASAVGSSGYKKKSKATNTMLQQWLADEGRRFETPAEGEKAMWLGGSVVSVLDRREIKSRLTHSHTRAIRLLNPHLRSVANYKRPSTERCARELQLWVKSPPNIMSEERGWTLYVNSKRSKPNTNVR